MSGPRARLDQGEVSFDTPALVELWRTAPYLHDGSCASLHELLTAGIATTGTARRLT